MGEFKHNFLLSMDAKEWISGQSPFNLLSISFMTDASAKIRNKSSRSHRSKEKIAPKIAATVARLQRHLPKVKSVSAIVRIILYLDHTNIETLECHSNELFVCVLSSVKRQELLASSLKFQV